MYRARKVKKQPELQPEGIAAQAINTLFCKNIVLPVYCLLAEAEYSYFSADSRLIISF